VSKLSSTILDENSREIWDTNQTALASTTANGFRIADIPYTGSPLASSTLYYWRIKFWDQGGLDSAYSTSSAFTLAPTLGSGQYVGVIQNTTFTYDAVSRAFSHSHPRSCESKTLTRASDTQTVGNITGLTDYADTGVGKTIAYTYDTLYRLTTASTTQASSTPYALSYTYGGNRDSHDYSVIRCIYASSRKN
jgi:hypothetical protein